MKILISGSSGLIGRALTAALEGEGHETAALVRPSSASSDGVRWDPDAGTIDAAALEGFDAVIHLAGENIADRRWTDERKARIRDSRVRGTALLADALAGLDRKPRAMLCASAAGYYGDRGGETLSDGAAPGAGFLAETTREWEEAAKPAVDAGIRVVNLRIGIVLSPSGGMLKRVLPIFRMGLGGKLGDGSQYMSWAAMPDLTRAIAWTLELDDIAGGVNVSSPFPITNAEFTRALGKALNRPALFAVPAFALRLAQGELADAVLSSVRMSPDRLLASGFEFRYADIESALKWAVGTKSPLP